MAVPSSSSHNSRVGSSSNSSDRNTSDPFQAYLGTTDGLASSIFAQATNPSGTRNHGARTDRVVGHQPGECMGVNSSTQSTGGIPPRGTIKGGMHHHTRGRNLQDSLVTSQLSSTASSPALGELLSSATYPVAAPPPPTRSTTTSSSLSPTALAYAQPGGLPIRGTTRQQQQQTGTAPAGAAGSRGLRHYHNTGPVSGQVRGEVPPLAEQYPPTQYSTTEMVLAEFGPDYANLSKRELLRIIRRHAPDAFLEEYNLKGQIYNAIKSRSHGQFVQLAEQLMENYMVYCGFQNGVSIPPDPQVAATAASVAAKMGVAGGRMPVTTQQQRQHQAPVTCNGPVGTRHSAYNGQNTQFLPSQEEEDLSESEVNTPPPGFEFIMPNVFSQTIPPLSSARSEDLAPSLSSFDNFTAGSVLAERGSSAASNLSVDAPSFTPSAEYPRSGYTSPWDAPPLPAAPTTALPDDSLAKLAEQLMRSYGFGRNETATTINSPFGLVSSPRNAPTTGTNVSVAGSGPHTGSTNASNSSDSVDFGSFGGFSGQFDLGTTGTSGASSSSSHLSATAATFTPSNSSWWNPLNPSTVSSSSISEPLNAPRRPMATVAATTSSASHSMPTYIGEGADGNSTSASLIANLSSSSSTTPSSQTTSAAREGGGLGSLSSPQDDDDDVGSSSSSNGVTGNSNVITVNGKQQTSGKVAPAVSSTTEGITASVSAAAARSDVTSQATSTAVSQQQQQ